MASSIKDLNFFIISARGNAGAVRVELHLIDHSSVVSELVDLLTSGDIPDSDSPIVTTGSNHTRVATELGRLNPVLMATKGLKELVALDGPQLDKLIIRGRHEHLTYSIELHRLDGSRVTLDNGALSTGVVVPDANGIIAGAGGNEGVGRVN